MDKYLRTHNQLFIKLTLVITLYIMNFIQQGITKNNFNCYNTSKKYILYVGEGKVCSLTRDNSLPNVS